MGPDDSFGAFAFVIENPFEGFKHVLVTQVPGFS
jgi:hypothetical protein